MVNSMWIVHPQTETGTWAEEMENSTKTEAQRKHFLKAAFFFLCVLLHQCFRKMSFITFWTSQISLCQVNEEKIKSDCDKEGFRKSNDGKKISILLNWPCC